MQKRPYSRRRSVFYASGEGAAETLETEPYEMRLYADLESKENCHVELRQDKVTHLLRPHIHVGKQARVVFTRSWVKVYVE